MAVWAGGDKHEDGGIQCGPKNAAWSRDFLRVCALTARTEVPEVQGGGG